MLRMTRLTRDVAGKRTAPSPPPAAARTARTGALEALKTLGRNIWRQACRARRASSSSMFQVGSGSVASIAKMAHNFHPFAA